MSLSTPILWVALPLIIAAIAGFFYNRRVVGVLLSSTSALILALLAALFPETMQLSLGPLTLVFEESMNILGRQITINYQILPFIALIYGITALWNLGSGIQGVPQVFQSGSLMIAALFTAAVGVKPFLYAALLIEIGVIISIPMLSPFKEKTHPGILRYLSLQTLAMPFILLAGWLLTGVETLPADSALVGQTMLVLGLGFSLLLSIFPFHSWVPMVSQQSHPTVTSFLLLLLPSAVLLFGLNFFNQYAFLRTSPVLYQTLRSLGGLMIVLGGAWTAVENNLKRALGFSFLTEIGISLLAVGLSNSGGLNWALMLLPVRALGFWLWQYALTLVETHLDATEMSDLQGFARRYPILSLGMLIGQLSIAGLPLLASFPIKLSLFTAAFEMGTGPGLWAFAGNLGLVLFTMRLLISLLSADPKRPDLRWHFLEATHEYLPILIIILILILLGIFPNAFPAKITQTLSAFPKLR